MMSKAFITIITTSIILLTLTGKSRSSLFPNLPSRCPTGCKCDADSFGRKRVTCDTGGLRTIPTRQMDVETEILVVKASSNNTPNHLTIGRIFLELERLEEITISDSNLPAIGHSSFFPGKRLRVLNLNNNNITLLRDTDFVGLTHLKTLNLSDNLIGGSPSAPFHLLSNLTELSLSRNNITHIVPRLFLKLEKLEYLDLSDNPLTALNATDLVDVVNLKVLNLARCQIGDIHPSVYKSLPHLETLDLSDNELTRIASEDLKPLLRLKTLLLNRNKLAVIEDGTFAGLELDYLTLANNRIIVLAVCAFCDSSIERLDISANRLQTVLPNVTDPLFDTLFELNANENKELENPSSSISNLIKPLINVQRLLIANTKLDDAIDDTIFVNFSKLTHLDVSSNRLTNFSSKLFAPLVSLETLNLSFNQMYSISKDVLNTFDSLPALKLLYLHGNPWSCFKCHISSLMEWLKRTNSAYYNVCFRHGINAGKHCAKCASPDSEAGKEFHLISQKHLQACPQPRVQMRLTASEPKVGYALALIIIISLVIIIVSVSILYRRHGAVYYTHEEERTASMKQRITCGSTQVEVNEETDSIDGQKSVQNGNHETKPKVRY